MQSPHIALVAAIFAATLAQAAPVPVLQDRGVLDPAASPVTIHARGQADEVVHGLGETANLLGNFGRTSDSSNADEANKVVKTANLLGNFGPSSSATLESGKRIEPLSFFSTSPINLRAKIEAKADVKRKRVEELEDVRDVVDGRRRPYSHAKDLVWKRIISRVW